MKRVPFLTFIILNILSILSIPVFSSDWKHTTTMRDGDYYIDLESIIYDSPMVTFWWKVTNGECKQVRTTMNCKDKMWAIREAIIYKPNGFLDAVVHVTEKNLEWVGIVPDSAADHWQKLLCKDK